MRRKTVVLISCLLTLVFFSGLAHAGPATDRIRDMLQKVMSIQTDPQLQGPEQREQRRTATKGVIAANFDLETMAKNALDQSWPKLTGPQRLEFKSIFQDLFLDSYTRLVLDFLKKEEIRYTKEELNQGRALVKTTIIRASDEIQVEYWVASVKQEWLVQDVTIDGISIVEKYRKSFARVIAQESYGALLQKMRTQQKATGSSS
ncbi:MAG: ABC transporter substrate-binding protein [Deltaproteobacteria bacterium]|nr:ABC transporter substrate-binding protein [Deltaproteobacteria bacterium]